MSSRACRASFVALACVLLVGGVFAEDEGRPKQGCRTALDAVEKNRARLADAGVEIGIGFTAIGQANHKGGIATHPEGEWTTSWDGEISLDFGKLGLWEGGGAFVHLEGSNGDGIDARHVGSLFGVNGDELSTDGRSLQMSEYFVHHTFGDGVVTVTVGKQDGTNDLDTNAYANDECCEFLNSALVNNPTVPFPDYALGAQVVVQPCERIHLAAIVLDANADGGESGFSTAFSGDSQWFFAAEAGLGAGRGALRVGGWHDSSDYDALARSGTRQGAWGAYVSADQLILREGPDEEGSQGLGLFARYGYAPDDFSEVEHFWSAGFQYRGPIPTRDDDSLGMGIARGCVGSPVRDETRHNAESVLEAYYRAALTDFAAVTLDLQYIRRPGANADSTLVPGLRVQIDF